MQAIWVFLKSNPSLLVSVTALIFSIISFGMARAATLYSDMDGRYMDLLKMGMAKPQFRDADKTNDYKFQFSDRDRKEYELYAFAVWNIVETIVDRKKVIRISDKLYDTWKPVIREENRLHRAWLNNEENQHKFKPKFWQFIIGNKDFPCPKCEKTTGGSLCDRCTTLLTMARSKREMPVMIKGQNTRLIT